MDDFETSHAITYKDDSFSKLDVARLGGKLTRVLAKTCIFHPLFMFQTPGEIFGYLSDEEIQQREQKREYWADRAFVEVASWQLTREIGSTAHRQYLSDHLMELRYEYGFPPGIPVQEMRRDF